MMRGRSILLLIGVAQAAFCTSSAWALSEPARETIQLRLNFRNVVAPDGKGRLSTRKAMPLFREINSIWKQCGIQFALTHFGNTSAKQLDLPYPPQSQADLSTIDAKMNARGFGGAIPLTIAGPWSFFDPISQVYLNGLGWVYANGTGVSKVGAMMSAKKLVAPEAGLILAHELGHALSLPEGGDGTLMGPGTPVLSADQCEKTRAFAQAYLGEFRVRAPTQLAKAIIR
jgi:hypothetical protein